ncbi:glycosyltransferase family 2 protein [Nocardioides albus]|uniref:GT2 family glycosyltransferase n=1 Tax=Nocardioides albus TaxID=1841 RepID=A0A7W4ZZY9_9ACTN|nr:glycosyltransferase family 2 protein [Nocardioides albus]MBB3087157.1 GT2 family glycosyltransferase [Nocardioides albus]GGU07041.1 glycosyl transferase family 2 [Nocardioides albus]
MTSASLDKRRPSSSRTVIEIVIVTHNSEQVIDALLDSIPAASGDLSTRVVAVDCGSTDGTCARLRERDDCEVVETANVGYAAGINLGVETLGGSGPILVLNPDVRLHEHAVTEMVGALADPAVGIVAPRVLEADGRPSLSLRREPSLGRALGLSRTGAHRLTEKVSDPVAYSSAGVVDWALGAALLVSRECHDRLGGWDESYFLYSEETDLCLRARDIGLVTRYVPTAVCTHIGGGSGRSGRTHAMQVVNRVRLFRRRHGPLASALYFALITLGEVSWVVRGSAPSRTSLAALLLKRRRPAELGCSERLLPR